jgi:hypothetical protein
MLVSDRTAMAHQPLGMLVTLDKVFELVEGNLSNEKRTDIYEIGERFKGDPEDQGWALRVAKVICLLEFLRDLPARGQHRRFLVDAVGQPALVARSGRCEALHGPVHSEHGRRLKLQTARRRAGRRNGGYLNPGPAAQ